MATRLPKEQIVKELFLAIHKDDKETITRTGYVPRRIYTASKKTYISLREDSEEAVVRAQELFDGRCVINKDNLYVLKIQFTAQSLSSNATTCDTDAPYAPLLHRFVYSKDEEKYWKAWEFHADLPLNITSGTGAVLIACEWLLIE
jgi:hypothetical protein